ncbi:hypothetical protein H0H92_014860 [Tricholoma furcatifolium]|nr:hypothetical protein H0H92_014860 [Tricholoma furcatifolium]
MLATRAEPQQQQAPIEMDNGAQAGVRTCISPRTIKNKGTTNSICSLVTHTEPQQHTVPSETPTGHGGRSSVDSSSPAYWRAVGDLGAACENLGIRYFFVGGTAVTALSGPRTTRDIDIDIDDMDDAAPRLARALPGRLVGSTGRFGVVEYSMDGVPADLFDLQSWPQRTEWRQIMAHPYSVQLPQTGQVVNIPAPEQLLHDKRAAAEERRHQRKGPQDQADVEFLDEYVRAHRGA